jgi:hypothetical protein
VYLPTVSLCERAACTYSLQYTPILHRSGQDMGRSPHTTTTTTTAATTTANGEQTAMLVPPAQPHLSNGDHACSQMPACRSGDGGWRTPPLGRIVPLPRGGLVFTRAARHLPTCMSSVFCVTDPPVGTQKAFRPTRTPAPMSVNSRLGVSRSVQRFGGVSCQRLRAREIETPTWLELLRGGKGTKDTGLG